jgi:hypothetical protein
MRRIGRPASTLDSPGNPGRPPGDTAGAPVLKGGVAMAQGYCVKERKKVEIKDAKQVTMKNGRPAIQGVCPDCGTKIFKIGKLS